MLEGTAPKTFPAGPGVTVIRSLASDTGPGKIGSCLLTCVRSGKPGRLPVRPFHLAGRADHGATVLAAVFTRRYELVALRTKHYTFTSLNLLIRRWKSELNSHLLRKQVGLLRLKVAPYRLKPAEMASGWKPPEGSD
jgi:hypothetical protein